MARNPQWRMSAGRWKTTVESWVRRQRPKDLLNVDIFFDGVPVHGDLASASDLDLAYEPGGRTRPSSSC
jgi:DNA polymerase-3 subunit epsilon/CBS domain-containing protein